MKSKRALWRHLCLALVVMLTCGAAIAISGDSASAGKTPGQLIEDAKSNVKAGRKLEADQRKAVKEQLKKVNPGGTVDGVPISADQLAELALREYEEDGTTKLLDMLPFTVEYETDVDTPSVGTHEAPKVQTARTEAGDRVEFQNASFNWGNACGQHPHWLSSTQKVTGIAGIRLFSISLRTDITDQCQYITSASYSKSWDVTSTGYSGGWRFETWKVDRAGYDICYGVCAEYWAWVTGSFQNCMTVTLGWLCLSSRDLFIYEVMNGRGWFTWAEVAGTYYLNGSFTSGRYW